MDRCDGYVTEAHYAEHLAPILDALPADRRGILFAPRNIAREVTDRLPGVPCVVGHADSPSTAPLLVGGYQDLPYGRRPKVLVQHGAGQRYEGVESGSFAGGPGHEAADLFLCPRAETAAAEHARYRQPAVVVGCPKLDGWARIPTPERGLTNGTIAVTFHWHQYVKTVDGRPIPEAGWAWETWRDRIAQLAKVRTVIGHTHPRARRELEAWWAELGVEYVPNAVDLLARADTLILDNSSIGYEWAALDRHTVWLRGADWTDIPHGLRFGDPLPGPELAADATMDDLLAAVGEPDLLRWKFARAEVTDRVYGVRPGRAADVAAQALLDYFPNWR